MNDLKNYKLDLIKIKNSVLQKSLLIKRKGKSQADKIFTIHIPDKRLVSKLYRVPTTQ